MGEWGTTKGGVGEGRGRERTVGRNLGLREVGEGWGGEEKVKKRRDEGKGRWQVER